MKYSVYTVLFCLVFSLSAWAKEDVNQKGNGNKTELHRTMKFGNDCDPASAGADLDINNVRTRILNGGDVWWDLISARYEIPKINDANAVKKHSLFSGALWIGGQDQGGNLRLAAMTYRQRGSDFWPGPLDTITSNTSSASCDAYDRIFKVTRDEIEEHVENVALTGLTDNENIQDWPGNPYPGFNHSQSMAPYFDADGNGTYSPDGGDYPVLQNVCRSKAVAPEDNEPEDQPDMMLWFVYNDKGNIHTETQGQPIGMELRTTAFAYATNDEINNMTFYTTEIVNRSLTTLSNTYFGQWVDADLGNYADDYVGCDVGLSLGFCYNGDDNDEGILGYGLNPPSVGVDFFEGPKKDTTINGKDTALELGMSKFVYYNNNSNPINGNPNFAQDFYNYLQGKWRNGECIKRGGNGLNGSECTDFMFPGDSDTSSTETWTERIAGNQPADRRFLQTSGPFTLKPGAVNRVTVGVVWAKTSTGGAAGSLELLKSASTKAQELFDNCFDILNGPDAPGVEVTELDKEFIFSFTGTDDIEEYTEELITEGKLQEYTFQGYRIYQLKDATVNTGDLDNVDLAQEIFVCDLNDSVTTLVNNPFDGVLNQPLPKLMVQGDNEGLTHSVKITEDVFATGSNKSLVNHRNYYYLIVSYGALPGHPSREYLAGRKVTYVTATPRKSEPRNGGSVINAVYGEGPFITRMEGRGNGGGVLDLTQESIDEILANGFAANPTYEKGRGPINVKVIDPFKIPRGSFELVLSETPLSDDNRDTGMVAENTRWTLVRLPGDSIYSDTTIAYNNEQVILTANTNDLEKDWGLSVTINQVKQPGDDPNRQNNGLLDWSVTFGEDNQDLPWLTAIPDVDGSSFYDWIRAGVNGRTAASLDISVHDYFISGVSMDQFENFEDIWDGRVAPYRLAARNTNLSTPERRNLLIQGPAYIGSLVNQSWGLDNLSSVDFVITPDKSKWTRCVVFEMGEDPVLNEGNSEKFDIRNSPSLNIDGSEHPTEIGRSWFPGYAINVETGERLNLAFGEDSYQTAENGRDMKWNPTDNGGNYSELYPSFGGRHYIYIMGSYQGVPSTTYPLRPTYDEGNAYHSDLTTALTQSGPSKTRTINQTLFQAMWVIPSYMAGGYEMGEDANGMPVPPGEVKFRLRVAKPYAKFEHPGIVDVTNDNRPRYRFNTDGIFTETDTEVGKTALDLINVVPNPYYAFAPYYETSPVDNFVQIQNVPERCDISIYTIDGTLVRRFKKDNDETTIYWDLKNQARVPVASGMYIVHVDAGDLGEKIVKCMVIMRELDLDSF